MLPRSTAASLFVGVAAGAGASYLLLRNDDGPTDQAALARTRRRRLQSLPLPPGASESRHPALEHGCPPADVLREFPGFAVGWDSRLRVPRWVAEKVTGPTSRGAGDRSAHAFREDDGRRSPSERRGGGGGGTGGAGRGERERERDDADADDAGLDPRWRSTNEHYLASGYDRGHCAPAADFKGHPRALEATFTLSNIAPQVGPGMNRDYWARFERFVKTLALEGDGGDEGGRAGASGSEVVVFTGPLYLPQRVRPERGSPPNAPRYEMRHPMLGDPPRLVAVPTHFFKVALVLERKGGRKRGPSASPDGGVDEGVDGRGGGSSSGRGATAKAIGAWVMPNAPIPPETPLTAFCVPLSALEDAAGGRFFGGVVDEEKAAAAGGFASTAERLDAAALRWQARGRAAASSLEGRNRKGASAVAEAAAALLPLSPKLAGLLTGGGEDKKENDVGDDAGTSSSSSSTSHAAELLLSPPPKRNNGRGKGRGNSDSSSNRRGESTPPSPPRWSWLQAAAASARGGGGLSHICDVTECKLPAEDWYKSDRQQARK